MKAYIFYDAKLLPLSIVGSGSSNRKGVHITTRRNFGQRGLVFVCLFVCLFQLLDLGLGRGALTSHAQFKGFQKLCTQEEILY